MSNRWPNNGNSDIGGILKRKNPTTIPQNNEKNLLIFGYGCKIFRDDEKAKFIDQGKHLIAWMGNNSHKIDRYDVRATLSDLSAYEPPPGGYQNRLDYLTPEEKRAEELCEEERYYSLKHNDEEELMYQEEELKRLHQERSSTYGQVKFDYNTASETNSTNTEEDDNKSDEPDQLYTPPKNFEIPISIALPETMKQHAIVEKTAKFIATQGPQMEILIKAKQSNNPQFEFLNQNNILNPYYKFVLNALKNDTYPKEENQNDTVDNTKLETTQNSNDSFNSQSPISIQLPKKPVPIIQYKPSANCAYTQLISKIKGVPMPILTSTTNQLNLTNNSLNQQNQNNLWNTTTQNDNNQNNIENNKHINKIGGNGVEIKKISSALALAQCYSSDSDSDDENDEEQQNNTEENSVTNLSFSIPTENEKNVIDKTAAYVAKNGKQFEETLKMKGDERFLFLNENHEYHSYYIYKVTGVIPTAKQNTKNKTLIPAPVSFSIKSKDDNTMPIKPALPQETSDDELDNKNHQQALIQQAQTPVPISKLPEHVQKAIQLVENQLVAKSVKTAAGTQNIMGIMSVAGNQIRSRFDIDSAGNPINRQTLHTQTVLENQKELKRAEEKVKDRLAQIAREKLGLLSKEKQLQIERKKKAMAFLNQIKGTSDQICVNNDNNLSSNDNTSDKESVHSIPITSFGGEDDDKSDYEYHHNYRPSPFLTPEQPDDVEFVSITKLPDENKSKSRSRSQSKSTKHKKSKHHHSKKKSKRKSRSRSRSESLTLSPNNIHKHLGSKKSKKRKRDRD